VSIHDRPIPAAGPVGLAISIAMWAVLIYLQQQLSVPTLQLSQGWRWGMSLLFAADGIGTLLWSMAILAAARREDRLATTGPYALVRHPMYGALLWSGTAVVAFAFQSWLVLPSVILLHIIWIRLVIPEESDLRQRFGEAYTQYAADTGQFLPRLKSLKKAAQGPDELDG
jgi:protein-S-isoprenylcysteine O-methyltransferase Ste14